MASGNITYLAPKVVCKYCYCKLSCNAIHDYTPQESTTNFVDYAIFCEVEIFKSHESLKFYTIFHPKE